jgi:hypothetical protein
MNREWAVERVSTVDGTMMVEEQGKEPTCQSKKKGPVF